MTGEKQQASNRDAALGCLSLIVIIVIGAIIAMLIFGVPWGETPTAQEVEPTKAASELPSETMKPTPTPRPTPTPPPKPVQASAREILEEYRDNSLRADALYLYEKNGKLDVEVTGIIVNIDGAKVRIRGVKVRSGFFSEWYDVVCEGSEAWVASRVRPINKGMEIRITGRGSGMDSYNDFHSKELSTSLQSNNNHSSGIPDTVRPYTS